MKPVEVSGIVTAYSGNGRKLGYPTANISTNTNLRDGVYFGYADLGEYTNHPSLIFIGEPITIGDSLRRIEANLLDIDDVDFYGQELSLKICEFHRANELFNGVDELKKAMKTDEQTARSWFSQQNINKTD